jgi:hypothetical protein
MATDHIRYDILAQSALRGVVRTVLTDTASKGLLGDHHFKISFDTRAPGVKLSPRLREQYPEEMTIVLQHQFWDLEVNDEGFEVGLSFSSIPERLRIPFAAITAFFDPSVGFSLQFATLAEGEGEETEETAGEPEGKPGPALKPVERQRSGKALSGPRPIPVAAKEEEDGDDDTPTGGAEVVRLDRFRKK